MQKRGLVLAIILILVLGLSFIIYNYQRNIKLEQSYESKGWKLYKQGKYDEAIKEFMKYMERNPNNFYAHSGLGWSLYRKGIYDDAVDYFNKAISINQNNYDPYNGLGWSYFIGGKLSALKGFEVSPLIISLR